MSSESALLLKAWKSRNKLYEELFGPFAYSLPKGNRAPTVPEPGFSLDSQPADGAAATAVFSSPMSAQRITVLAYAPNDKRSCWTYVTSGLSNPWFKEAPDEVSGFGCELMVKSARDGRWPLRLLRRLSYYILSYTGTLSPGVILNMQRPLSARPDGGLNNIFVWYADEAPDCLYQLPSGVFGVFCAVGITEDECQFAESIDEYGCWSIQQVLRQTGVGQLTDPHRSSVMGHNDINGILQSVRSYADNFRPVQQ